VAGINIFTSERGLGGALTNPTELARANKCIDQSYPLRFAGRDWPDADAAYQSCKTQDETANDALMVQIIAVKLYQHRSLFDAINNLGGRRFLCECSHLSNDESEAAIGWEGRGLDSRFIRNFIGGFDLLTESSAAEVYQQTLL